MPTYQYRCRKCGEEFEKFQSFTDDSIPRCTGCGTRSKQNVSKVFGAVGISFKGSGFYKNDSAAAKNGSTADTKTSDAKSSDAKSDAKSSDTKSSDLGGAPAAATSASSD